MCEISLHRHFKDWPGNFKVVDNAYALEMVPRYSPSLLPLVVNNMSDFTNERGVILINPKKCKQMLINFLKYGASDTNQQFIVAGNLVETVSCFKLFGVWITNCLLWNVHVDKVFKKADSRLYRGLSSI